MQTELILSIGGLPPMSARGCIQELRPIPQGEMKRTVNGELIFIGNNKHKYYSKITCNDKEVIATEGLQIGGFVKVGCVQKLCQKIDSSEKNLTVTLEREPVSDSVFVIDEEQNEYNNFSLEGSLVTFQMSDIKIRRLFVFYCPQLDMRVKSFTLSTDEWAMKTNWILELEEV